MPTGYYLDTYAGDENAEQRTENFSLKINLRSFAVHQGGMHQEQNEVKGE